MKEACVGSRRTASEKSAVAFSKSISVFQPGISSLVESNRILWIQAEGVREVVDRSRRVALSQPYKPALQVRFGHLWI